MNAHEAPTLKYRLLSRDDWSQGDPRVPAVLKRPDVELGGNLFTCRLVCFAVDRPVTPALAVFPASQEEPTLEHLTDLYQVWVRIGHLVRLVSLQSEDGSIAYSLWQGDIAAPEVV